ncbi:MAG: ABC transporter permease [Kofleriaceae bacterium]|nr:ABC transporter permease [Myxococcales bacterium]MCB9561219.1 ABC transporter permease [Kofleriaceae bacterium]MCB9573798.1 ABC transporter permease [Kofleriaceae bacterium]
MATRIRRALLRIRAVQRKEWMHIGRDATTLYFAIGMPLVLLILFGYAVSFDIDHITTVVVDQDRTSQSRDLVRHLDAGPTFDVVGEAATPEAAEQAFRRGKAHMIIIVPPGYGRDLQRGDKVRVQMMIDAADNTSAQSILGYTARFSAHVTGLQVRQVTGRSPPLLEARIRALYNPGSRSAVFLVPGLIAVIQAMMAVVLTALAVAREWERGSMEQLFATPVGRLEIVAGKLAPYFVIGVAQLLIVLAVGVWLFDVPVRGSLVVLAVLSGTFLTATLAQGLLISVVAKNQMAATQMGAMSSMLPSLLLSGFILPIANMPAVLRAFTNVIPARHFIHGLRAVMLRDAPLSHVMGDVGRMAAFAGVMIFLCLVRFKRKVR